VKRFLPLVLLGACVPDIAQNPPPSAAVVAEFNPDPQNPSIPTPNDLAINPSTGLVSVPSPPGTPAAQKEFNTDYLGKLRGFPFESTASVTLSAPVDPQTVTPQNVYVVDLSAASPVLGAQPVLDATGTTITVPPPYGAWSRNHRYAVALIGGKDGVKGANGEPVIGSPAWTLVRGTSPLVRCQDQIHLSPASSCEVLADIIPATGDDPQTRHASQVANAIQLEQVRVAYQPVFNVIRTLRQPTDPADIAVAWTFGIVDAGEVTFDPAGGIIPFPNDLLRNPTTGKVALPDPSTRGPLDCSAPATPIAQLYCGLNTLDGFSTTVAPISENGDTAPAVAQAHLDPAAAPTRDQAGLVAVNETMAAPEERGAPLEWTPCLDCVSSAAAAGTAAPPQQLQWRLDAPLTERTTYLAYLTSDVKDDQGKPIIANPIFALVRLKNPLVGPPASGGHSQVPSLLSDAQAAQLEPLRAALAPALDMLEAKAGIPRSNLALAWAFTTQSEGSQLDAFYAYGAAAQTQGIYVFADQTAQYQTAAMSAGAPVSLIGKFYFGLFPTSVAVTGPGGVADLTPGKGYTAPVPFVLAVPDPSKVPQPPMGYPITIFGHGLTRDRNDVIGIANTLASIGQATIAIDAFDHGERSSCTGSGAFLSQLLGMSLGDDDACADPMTQKCDENPIIGRCVAKDDTTRIRCPGLGLPGPDMTGNLVCLAQHRGLCAADKMCEGGDFRRDVPGGRPVISGWNIFSLTNFFATRDNFRQQVIDLAALIHTLHVTPLDSQPALGSTKFDLTKIDYVGQSLGGILGTLFAAASPDTTSVVLNVPGGDLTRIILEAPSFAAQKTALLLGLATQGIAAGTPQFDSFIGTAQWILDPADPANFGWRLTRPVTLSGGSPSIPAGRKAFIQFIEGDQTVPNSANLALVAAADRPFLPTPPSFGCTAPLYCYEFTEADAMVPFDSMSVPLDARHGFLLKPPSTSLVALQLTAAAQAQVVTFLSMGHL